MNRQTQSIIVYRNPMEQAFWESGAIIPLFGSGIVFVLVIVAMDKLIGMKYGWRKPLWTQWAMWAVATASAFATMKLLWL